MGEYLQFELIKLKNNLKDKNIVLELTIETSKSIFTSTISYDEEKFIENGYLYMNLPINKDTNETIAGVYIKLTDIVCISFTTIPLP